MSAQQQQQNANQYYATPVTGQPQYVVQQQQPQQPRSSTFTREERRAAKSCCCNFTKATACIFIVLLCIGGGALIAVGASHILRQTEHYMKIDEYNDYVKNLELKYPSDVHRMSNPTDQRVSFDYNVASITVQQPATENGTTTTASGYTHSVDPNTAVEGLSSYSSRVYTATVAEWSDNARVRYTVHAQTQNQSLGAILEDSLVEYVPFEKKESAQVHCNHEACADNCDEKWDRKCRLEELKAYCTNTYGPGASYSGDDSCEGDDLCGTCHFDAVLEHVCVVMEEQMVRGFSHHIDSCFYPFNIDSQKYAPKKDAVQASLSNVKVTFRSSADPFIQMQRITAGTMDFGSPIEHSSTGAMMVILGLALIIVPCCAGCCYMCCTRNDRRRRHVEEGEEGPSAQPQQMVVAPAPALIIPQQQAYPSAVEQGYPVQQNPVAADPYAPTPADEGRLFGPRSSTSSAHSNNNPGAVDDNVEIEFEQPRKTIA